MGVLGVSGRGGAGAGGMWWRGANGEKLEEARAAARKRALRVVASDAPQ